MWRPGLIAIASAVLIACGGSPDEPQMKVEPAPPDAGSTELLDSTQATLDRALGVQDTVNERAVKLDAQTREALGEGSTPAAHPNEDPDAGARDD